jgi:phosphoglycerate dehydrogenase-like enzyme
MSVTSRAVGRCVGEFSILSPQTFNYSPGRILSKSACRSIYSASTPISKKAWSPQSDQYKFWNREESKSGQASMVLDMSPESIQKEARIICLSGDADAANNPLLGKLPFGTRLLHVGSQSTDFPDRLIDESPNVVFVSPSCPHARLILPLVLAKFPTIEWIHVRSAGIDFLESDELPYVAKKGIIMTNAKGQFSSSLAEYAMMACSYFAKDIPRLLKNKRAKLWDDFEIEELRGKTMGIVGYGDIGRATAKLASVYGMKVIALRRNPEKSEFDPVCDEVLGTGRLSLQKLMSVSDYVVCSAPSTVETRGMVNEDAFKASKKNQVFINLGRGPVVDEEALVVALKNGTLRGAALDVFATEPLPAGSALWDLDQVLISPHNMDKTATFMHEATEFFVHENLPRFMLGHSLLNKVDISLGY